VLLHSLMPGIVSQSFPFCRIVEELDYGLGKVDDITWLYQQSIVSVLDELGNLSGP
jgi:hypothetical protein